MSERHLKCSPEDIADAVMLVGDPHRAEHVSTMLKEPRLVNSSRGLLVYTGDYKNTRLTIATTSMGAPSAAIVMEELCNLGASIFIRVGSAGGLAPQLASGDIVIATAAIREDGTSACYLRPTFPAISDFALLNIILESASNIHPGSLPGIVISHDAFYRGLPDDELIKLRDAGAVAREMETGCIFIVAQVRRVRAAALFALGGNIMRPGERSEEAFHKAEMEAIQIGLDSLVKAANAGLATAK
jgi:DeoD family purine-nucleoside phosphorylase